MSEAMKALRDEIYDLRVRGSYSDPSITALYHCFANRIEKHVPALEAELGRRAKLTRNSTLGDVKCPYCGESNELWDLYDDAKGQDTETECCECEKTFRVAFNVSISARAMSIEPAA